MAEKAHPSLETLQGLFRKGAYDRVRVELDTYLAANPDDADAVTLQRHLDNLEILKQINRSILTQKWELAAEQVEVAIEQGLIWDIELYPLPDLLASIKERRTETANRKAQSLLRQAEAAQEQEDVGQAHELLTQALAVPHLAPALRFQLKSRLDSLRPGTRPTLSTMRTLLQPGALMEQLVGTILAKSRPQVSEAVRLCAVPFWFDLELLSALRQSDDGLDEKVMRRMVRLTFIQEDDRGRYTFSQDVRQYLLSEWGENREGFVEANRRAQSYFEHKLREAISDDEVINALIEPDKPILPHVLATASPQVSELIQHYLYHTLAVDGETGIVLLRQIFHAAEETYRLALAERCLEVANEQRALLNPDQRSHIDYLRGLLASIQEQFDDARGLFERMLSREGLPPSLQARVRRALGNTLIQQEQWVEAIALFESALRQFQTSGDALESALTMINLGQAHLDLALNTWGGGEAFGLRKGWLNKLKDLALLVGRLPIVVYLMSHLGVRNLLPVILRVGRDMDWLVARLFVTAAGWFNRADGILRQLNDKVGLGRIEENLAWLYLLLGHYKQAEATYRRLLTREGTTLGEYRAARARLRLAEALIHQCRLARARELLEQILPIFRAYRHTERVAQTHTGLAQTYALEGQLAQAAAHYQQAAQLFRQLGLDADATEVVEQIQLLGGADESQIDEATRQSILATTSQITRRRYMTRFSLPLLQLFQLLGLVGLTGVMFFSLFTSFQPKSGTDFNVSETMFSSQASSTSPFEPTFSLQLTSELEPSFGVSFTLYLIVAAILVYLVLYTLVGLWLTVRTPLRTLQEGQRFDVVVHREGVRRGTEGLPGSLRIKWGQVAAVLVSDRSIYAEPIPLFSRFALFGEQGAVVVGGETRRYEAACNYIQEHLNRPNKKTIPTHQFGFSILRSRSGRLLVATLAFIVAFYVVAQVAPQVLTAPLGPFHYSLADLYGFSYLGLMAPLGWWMALQPLRERIFLKPHTRRVWLTGFAGLALAVFTVADMLWLKLPIGRPNVAPGLLSIFLLGLAVYYAWTARRWEHMPFRKGARVYALPVRLLSGVAALVIVLLVLGLLGRELAIYHNLALASFNQQQAAKAQDDARAQEFYEKALSSYDRALEWAGGAPSNIYHSRGVVLTLLGRYEEAVDSIQKAIRRNPHKPDYNTSLAIAYWGWASAAESKGDENAHEYYELSRKNYTRALGGLREDDRKRITLYLGRAGASSQLGEYYSDEFGQDETVESRQAAIESYQAAYEDYDRVLAFNANDAEALSGRGWMGYKAARLKDREDANRASELVAALADLQRAADVDPRNATAWSGQGWTHFAIGERYAWWDEVRGRARSACADSERNPRTPAEAEIYRDENLEAIAAFEQAAALAPDNADFYSVQGYVRFNLVDCPGLDNQETYLAAAEDFGRALALEPNDLEWRLRRANLYIALGSDYRPQAIADYETLVSLQPDADWYWTLGTLYRAQGEWDEALGAYSESLKLDPTNYDHQVLLGWYAYLGGDYALATEASQTAADLDASDPRPFFNRGLAFVAQGDAGSAEGAYEDGITAANALTDLQVALDRYDEALGDLGDVPQDPAGVADLLRARLTFAKGLVYVRLDSADPATATYEAGIAVASTLRDQETRRAAYAEAIEDLQALDGASTRLVTRLLVSLRRALRE